MIAANFTSVLDWNKAIWGGIGLFVYVYFVNAWVSDDAFITFRTVENFIAGYGPNYNVEYRVQGYSHPLWFLLLSLFYFVFDGVGVDLNGNTLYYLTIGLSFLFSVGTVYFLVFFISKDKRMGVMGVVLLLMSKSFIDYTSSGLENPLSYFILTVYVYIYFSEDLKGSKKIFMLSLMAGLGAFTRLDHVLIYLPSLLLYLWQSKINLSNIKLFLAGWLPLIIWEIFSVIYYGLPFPNTAYAKLNHGLTRPDLLLQGVFYYVNILFMDPIILFVLGYVIVRFLKNTRYLPLVLGMVLYLVYIIWIGGDFMSGRFFSLLYLLSVILICKAGYIRTLDYVMIMILGLGIGLSSYHPPLFSSSSYGLDETGNYDKEHLGRLDIFNIADERAYYYPNLGLLRVNYNFDLPPNCGKTLVGFMRLNAMRLRWFSLLGIRDMHAARMYMFWM